MYSIRSLQSSVKDTYNIVIGYTNEELKVYLRTLFVDVSKIIYEYCMDEYNVMCYGRPSYGHDYLCKELRIGFCITNKYFVFMNMVPYDCILLEYFQGERYIIRDCNILIFLNEVIKYHYNGELFDIQNYTKYSCTYSSDNKSYEISSKRDTVNITLSSDTLGKICEFIEVLRVMLKEKIE